MTRFNKKDLDYIISKSQVPVFFLSIKEAKRKSGIKTEFAAYYQNDRDKTISQFKYIAICKNLSNYNKLCAFYHEYGHYICDKNNCECVGKNRFLEEYHANKYCLQQLYDTKSPIIEAEIEWIKYMIKHNLPEYYNSAKKITKTKLWKNSLKLTKEIKKNNPI